MREEELEVALKVVIVGNGGVGKSSMIQRYCRGTFTRDYKKTIGVDFLERQIDIDGEEVRLMLWDTAGQEEFDAITKAYYRGANACVLAFSTTDRDSFLALHSWKLKSDPVHYPNMSRLFYCIFAFISISTVNCLINAKYEELCVNYYRTGEDFDLKSLEGTWHAVYYWPAIRQQRDYCTVVDFKRINRFDAGCSENIPNDAIIIKSSYTNSTGKQIDLYYYGEEEVKYQVENECGEIPTIIVQNKIDLMDQCVVGPEEAELVSRALGCRLMRASVKEDVNVGAVFRALATRCLVELRRDSEPPPAAPLIGTFTNHNSNGTILLRPTKHRPGGKKKNVFKNACRIL